MSAFLAALLIAAQAALSAEVPRLPEGPVEPLAPIASAAQPGIVGQQNLLGALSLNTAAQINAFGVPGPGIQDAHVASMQNLADTLQTPIFAYGSRQTGVRRNGPRTGEAWGGDSDLNLGIVGELETFFKAARERERFLDQPDVRKVPTDRAESIVEAVHAGHFVVAPRGYDDLRALSAPWRTDRQLDRLGRTTRSPDEKFKFAVIGDAEPGRFRVWRWLFNRAGVFERQLADADRRGADFIMQLGDMVSRGIPSHFSRFFDMMARVAPRTPYLTIIGNHDRHKPHGVTNDRVYRSLFGPTDYYFDRGGYRFVALDSSAGRVTGDQLVWLDRILDTPLKTVVFTHMMPNVIRESSSAGGAFAMGGFKEGAAEFARIAARRRVQRVYMGHIHAFGIRKYLGVPYVLTGGGGSPIYPTVSSSNAFHHYLTVEAGPDGLVETVHTPDGRSYPLR